MAPHSRDPAVLGAYLNNRVRGWYLDTFQSSWDATGQLAQALRSHAADLRRSMFSSTAPAPNVAVRPVQPQQQPSGHAPTCPRCNWSYLPGRGCRCGHSI